MADCVMTLSASITAVSGRVKYRALPNQIVDSVAVDTTDITASVSTTNYTATLLQKARYRVIAPAFGFHDQVFECPEASTEDLKDVLTGLRDV